MNQTKCDPSRRRLIGCVFASALATPLFDSLRRAEAAEKISPDDPLAKSLGYTHASGDASKRCGNCSFFQGKDAEWGPCVVLSGKSVAAAGHCTAWAAR